MTLREQCESCAEYEFCRHAYGDYFVFRAKGWDPSWSTDGPEPPVKGCRHRVPRQDGRTEK